MNERGLISTSQWVYNHEGKNMHELMREASEELGISYDDRVKVKQLTSFSEKIGSVAV